MISNPFNFCVNNTKKEKFTYKGGSKLFHFSPYDNGLSVSMENNLIFFADDEQHALTILRDAFQFACVCNMKFQRSLNNTSSIHYMEFQEEAKKENKKYQSYIDAIAAGKIKLTEAPTNQFYIIGWADNDTIH